MRDLKKIVEVKNGNKWVISHETTDTNEIYRSLSRDLIAKKFNGCTYIKSIKKTPNYDGTNTVKVYHDNGVKVTYIIES